jgi:hypothetical protein
LSVYNVADDVWEELQVMSDAYTNIYTGGW